MDRETELAVTWQPELVVHFRQEPDDVEDLKLFLDAEHGEVRLRLPVFGIDTPAILDGTASDGRLTEVVWGDDEQVHRVRFHLTAQGTYAVTHIGELARADGGLFGAGELQQALTCIHFLFSFARAAWSAPMLPVGFNRGGVPVWRQAIACYSTTAAECRPPVTHRGWSSVLAPGRSEAGVGHR
jgi:hypothetical protein